MLYVIKNNIMKINNEDKNIKIIKITYKNLRINLIFTLI